MRTAEVCGKDAAPRYARGVASFSFRAGNAAKLLRIPLYAVGRIANAVIPRGNRWVFGCGAGIGDGALALYRLAREEGHDVLWLTNTPEEAAATFGDIRTVAKGSVRGWWATARAGVVVVTHGLGDVNRYTSSGALLVQAKKGQPFLL